MKQRKRETVLFRSKQELALLAGTHSVAHLSELIGFKQFRLFHVCSIQVIEYALAVHQSNTSQQNYYHCTLQY